MLNCLMVDVRVDTINDTHRLVRGGDVGLHSNHAVLDIVHELFLVKRPIFVVVVPSLVWISPAQWSGGDVWPQHHPGQRQGSSPVKHEHGRD